MSENPRAGMPTFGEVWKTMRDEADRPKLSPATIVDYEDRADRLILPKIGKTLIVDVTAAVVNKIVAVASDVAVTL